MELFECQTSKRYVFECVRYLYVQNLSPHCILILMTSDLLIIDFFPSAQLRPEALHSMEVTQISQ